jgi:hypothetical protein
MKLTHKERQDILWSLKEQVNRLDALDSEPADKSAARLQKLLLKVESER